MTYISSLFIISIRSNQDHGKTLCNILFVVISNNPFFTSYRVKWVYFCRMVVFTSTSIYCTFSTYSISIKLEILALWVFLSADAQLLGTILAGARMPLSMCFQSLLRFAGAALGFQMDGAKPLFSPKNRGKSSEPCLLVEYFKISMVQLHPLHHPNAAPGM